MEEVKMMICLEKCKKQWGTAKAKRGRKGKIKIKNKRRKEEEKIKKK